MTATLSQLPIFYKGLVRLGWGAYTMSVGLTAFAAAWRHRQYPRYFVARRRKINKTIEEQHRSGRILLPNDPGFHEFQPDIVT